MAKTRVGQAEVDLTLETGKFKKGAQDARAELDKIEDRAVAANRNWQDMAIAVTGATVAIGFAAKKFADFTIAGGRVLDQQRALDHAMGNSSHALRLLRMETNHAVADTDLLEAGLRLAEDANKDFAKALRVNVTDLTAAQRAEAFRTIGLRKMREESLATGQATDNAGTSFRQLAAEIQNTATAGSVTLANWSLLEASVDVLTVGVRGMRGEWEGASTALMNFVAAYTQMAEVVGKGGGDKSNPRDKGPLDDGSASLAEFRAHLELLSNSVIPETVGAINPLTGALEETFDIGKRFPPMFLDMSESQMKATLTSLRLGVEARALALGMRQVRTETEGATSAIQKFSSLASVLGGVASLFSLPGLSSVVGKVATIAGIGGAANNLGWFGKGATTTKTSNMVASSADPTITIRVQGVSDQTVQTIRGRISDFVNLDVPVVI